MKIYIVVPGKHWKSEREPIKCFFKPEDAKKFVEFGESVYKKFEQNRYHRDRLSSLSGAIWATNRLVKSKKSIAWRVDDRELYVLYFEECKELLSEEELFYHYQHCQDNNLKHIRCYDSYEIIEHDVE